MSRLGSVYIKNEMTQEHERAIGTESAIFEKWARPDSHQRMKTDAGEYIDRGAAAAWSGWMARANLANAEIARLTGETAVLRDLLRDALAVVCTIDGENDDEVASLYDLTVSMREAINGHDAGLLSDGEIYEAASRRLAPETYLHKKTGRLYEVLCNATRESDGVLMVVYKSIATGDRWVRPADEFNDGRFERVNAVLEEWAE